MHQQTGLRLVDVLSLQNEGGRRFGSLCALRERKRLLVRWERAVVVVSPF